MGSGMKPDAAYFVKLSSQLHSPQVMLKRSYGFGVLSDENNSNISMQSV